MNPINDDMHKMTWARASLSLPQPNSLEVSPPVFSKRGDEAKVEVEGVDNTPTVFSHAKCRGPSLPGLLVASTRERGTCTPRGKRG